VAMGWGYVLTSVIFAPVKQMEDTLTMLTKNIMHELNIPLSTIEANTSMLKKSVKDEKSLKRLQRIDDASSRLKKLYAELVYTLTKEIEEIQKERFFLKNVAEERIAFFQEQARNPFEVKIASYEIEVDKIGFEQMLDNILVNAMKYSDKDALISLTLDENILCIQDRGIGMTTSELLRVHERYFKGNENSQGEGIGLALVKAYCDSENIQVQVQSEKNVGTGVYLSLAKVHI
jgi:signal transduction histidine kinase